MRVQTPAFAIIYLLAVMMTTTPSAMAEEFQLDDPLIFQIPGSAGPVDRAEWNALKNHLETGGVDAVARGEIPGYVASRNEDELRKILSQYSGAQKPLDSEELLEALTKQSRLGERCPDEGPADFSGLARAYRVPLDIQAARGCIDPVRGPKSVLDEYLKTLNQAAESERITGVSSFVKKPEEGEEEFSCGTDKNSMRDPRCAKFSVLLMDQNDRVFCSGTLLSGRLVLTAAHCVCGFEDENPNNLTVVMGESYKGFTIKVNKIHRYNSASCNGGTEAPQYGDLALLRLAPPDNGDLRLSGGTEYSLYAMVGHPDWTVLLRDAAAITTRQVFRFWTTGVFEIEDNGRTQPIKIVAETYLKGERKAQNLALPEVLLANKQRVALCSGDSGGGIFMPLQEDQAALLTNYAPWAVVGVIVGYGNDGSCEDGGQLNFEERNIIRLDGKAWDWIKTTACPSKDGVCAVYSTANVEKSYPTQVAESN